MKETMVIFDFPLWRSVHFFICLSWFLLMKLTKRCDEQIMWRAKMWQPCKACNSAESTESLQSFSFSQRSFKIMKLRVISRMLAIKGSEKSSWNLFDCFAQHSEFYFSMLFHSHSATFMARTTRNKFISSKCYIIHRIIRLSWARS